MRIVESTIIEHVCDGVQMITTSNRNVGRNMIRAMTTIIYSVRHNDAERWRSEVPVLGFNWQDRRNSAQEQERIANTLRPTNKV